MTSKDKDVRMLQKARRLWLKWQTTLTSVCMRMISKSLEELTNKFMEQEQEHVAEAYS